MSSKRPTGWPRALTSGRTGGWSLRPASARPCPRLEEDRDPGWDGGTASPAARAAPPVCLAPQMSAAGCTGSGSPQGSTSLRKRGCGQRLMRTKEKAERQILRVAVDAKQAVAMHVYQRPEDIRTGPQQPASSS